MGCNACAAAVATLASSSPVSAVVPDIPAACMFCTLAARNAAADVKPCGIAAAAVPDCIWGLQRLRESLPSGGAAGVKSSLSWMAGIVIVGDEILSGKVEDSNIRFLCQKLYEIGWTVRKVGLG